MNKKWEVCQQEEEKVIKLAEENNLSPLLASILINRNIDTNEKVKQFVNPTRDDFHDPFLMPDMDKAVERIIKAIDMKEKVMIYGDYDVDGITSITVLKTFLLERGLEVGEYTPNRLEEGYGLNKQAVKWYSGLWYFWK